MCYVIQYGEGLYLSEKQEESCRDAIIETLKKELPEEALCVDVIKDVCNSVIDYICTRQIHL